MSDVETVYLLILFFLLVNLILYFIYSYKFGSYINFLTPSFIYTFPINFIFEPININEFGLSGSLFGYFFIYSLLTTQSLTLFIILLKIKPLKISRNSIFSYNTKISNYLPFILLAISVLIYLPIIIEFRNYLDNPREIYIQTRSGYGHIFFISTLFTFLAYIAVLFLDSKYKFLKFIFFLACSVILFLHGSKGQIISLLMIYFFYYVFIMNRKVNFYLFTIFCLFSLLLLIFLFYFLHDGFDISNFLILISSYSDYNRNALMVIDSNIPIMYGQLTLENEFWSRVPRVIFPDKPLDFGVFYLAKIFLPESFYNNQGSPGFGVGIFYADYKYLSYFVILFINIAIGYFSKIIISNINIYKNIGLFIILLFLSGVNLVPTGSGYLIIEHLLIALFFSSLLVIKKSNFK